MERFMKIMALAILLGTAGLGVGCSDRYSSEDKGDQKTRSATTKRDIKTPGAVKSESTNGTKTEATEAKPSADTQASQKSTVGDKKKDTGTAAGPLQTPTVEGEVLKITGDSYFVKDISGKEVRLDVDKDTKKDSNVTVGDKIVARVDTLTSPTHASSLQKR